MPISIPRSGISFWPVRRNRSQYYSMLQSTIQAHCRPSLRENAPSCSCSTAALLRSSSETCFLIRMMKLHSQHVIEYLPSSKHLRMQPSWLMTVIYLLGIKILIGRRIDSRSCPFAGLRWLPGSSWWGIIPERFLISRSVPNDLESNLLLQLQRGFVCHINPHNLCVKLSNPVWDPSWFIGVLYCTRRWTCSRHVVSRSANSALYQAGEVVKCSCHWNSAVHQQDRRKPVQPVLQSYWHDWPNVALQACAY